jgi:hypothetical protein
MKTVSCAAVLLLAAAPVAHTVSWHYDRSWPAADPSSYLDPTAKKFKPTGLAFKPETGGVVVIYRTTNTSFPPFMELDAAGNIVQKWGQGQVAYAHDITWEDHAARAHNAGVAFHEGDIWFTDTHAATVNKLDAKGDVVAKKIGHPFVQGHDVSPLEFSNVSHIAFLPDASAAFITDGDSLGSGNPGSNHRLVKIDPQTGAVAWVLGNNGTVKGNHEYEFCDPHFSSYDAKRDWIWVADRGHNRTAAFSAKDGSRTCADISTKPWGFAPNTVIVDESRQWLVLAGPPCDTHICTRYNGPFEKRGLQSQAEGPSTFLVLDISDPCSPKKVFGPMVLEKAGAHNIDFDSKTGDVYIDYLTGNALQKLKMHADAPAKTMKTTWFNFSYVTSGFNLCNEATNICRSLGHWVFTVAPESLSDAVVTGASYSIDGGPYMASKRGNFEAHFVNGQCSNTSDASTCVFYDDKRKAQVWNIGYDVIQQGTAKTLKLPKKVCAKVWMQVPATGEMGNLDEELCADFTTASFNIPPGGLMPNPDLMYSLSADAATYLCNDKYCRADGHISVDVQLPDPTQELIGLTEYSIDGGAWTSAKTNTFFEQKVKHIEDRWYHTISWNYDDVMPKTTKAPEEICIRMAVQNQVTLSTWQMDFGEYASKGDKHQRCIKFCTFAMPFSHAPAAGGYCPSKPPPSSSVTII